METLVNNFLSDSKSLRKYYQSPANVSMSFGRWKVSLPGPGFPTSVGNSILPSPGNFVCVYYLWKIIDFKTT